MEITVKKDVKIDSDKVLKLLSSHIESSNKSGVKLLYVNSSLLKDAYDLIKYFEGKEESKEKKNIVLAIWFILKMILLSICIIKYTLQKTAHTKLFQKVKYMENIDY